MTEQPDQTQLTETKKLAGEHSEDVVRDVEALLASVVDLRERAKRAIEQSRHLTQGSERIRVAAELRRAIGC